MTASPNKPASSPSPRAKLRDNLRWYFGREWLRLLALVVCGVVARFPALGGQLIWDDEYLVRSNPFIKSPLLILETFRHYLFPDAFSPHYRPVQNVSYCFDYLVWRGEAYGFHISNVFWHVCAGLLLYRLLRCVFGDVEHRWQTGGLESPSQGAIASGIAFCVALLWLVHPVHSAAVDYISGRADSLAACFACGAWLLFLMARKSGKTWHRVSLLVVATGLCLLALGSRESACLWVAIFLVYLVTLERTLTVRARMLSFVATLGLVAIYAGLRHLPSVQVQGEAAAGTPWPVRFVLMFRALGDYGRLLLFPINLHMERTLEAPEALLGNAGWRHAITSEYLSLGGLLFAAALCFGAFRAGRARVIRAFGAGWFIVAFLPISNLIPLNASVAEHWLYLPSIGFIIFLSGCALELPVSVRRFVPALVMIAIFALVARSINRSGDWVSAETFYRRSLAAGGAKPRMALNLGLILVAKGDYEKAETLLRRVVKIYPDYPIASNALAHALFRQGKLDEARQYFHAASEAAERTRQEYPRTWIAALNIAHMQYREHDLPGAILTAEKARADYPGTWELISFESELLRATKGPPAALPIVEQFVHDNWWHADAAIAAGKLYSEAGSSDKAEAAFRHAARLDILSVDALNLLALLQVRQSRFEEALETQRRALARQPQQPRQHLLLADILEKMGRTPEAHKALDEVRRLESTVRGKLAAN